MPRAGGGRIVVSMERIIRTVLAGALALAPIAAAPRGGVDELRRAVDCGILTRLEIAQAEYARAARDGDAGEVRALDREVLGIIDDQVRGEAHRTAAIDATGVAWDVRSGARPDGGRDASAPGGDAAGQRAPDSSAGRVEEPDRIRQRYAALAGSADADSVERKAAMIDDLRARAQAQVPGYDTPLPKGRTFETQAVGTTGLAPDPTTPIRPGAPRTASVFAR